MTKRSIVTSHNSTSKKDRQTLLKRLSTVRG